MDFHGQLFLEPGLFQFQIAVHMVELRMQAQHVAVVFQRLPVIAGQGQNEFPGPVRILPADIGDGVQRVVEKMWVYLGLEGAQLGFAAQLFLVFQVRELQLGGEQPGQLIREAHVGLGGVPLFFYHDSQTADGLVVFDQGSRYDGVAF